MDVADVQRDMEEEVEGTLMIMAFLFAPIIIGVLLAIFVCCRGYKPSQDPDVQVTLHKCHWYFPKSSHFSDPDHDPSADTDGSCKHGNRWSNKSGFIVNTRYYL